MQLRRKRGSINDCIIMADTETSKAKVNEWYYDKKLRIKYVPVDNYVVAWTLSIRAFDTNIVTLYGHRPSEFITCLMSFLCCIAVLWHFRPVYVAGLC